MPLGIKTVPTLGATSLNQRNKDVEFICGENDIGERSRAIMALLFSETAYPILMKFRRNVPAMVLFKICWKNLIPLKAVFSMATKLKKKIQIFENLIRNHKV